MQKINVPQVESRVFGLRDYAAFDVDEATLDDDLDPLSLSAVDDDRIGEGGEDDLDDVLRDFNVALSGEDD